MKKCFITLVLLFGLGAGSFAQFGGGLFKYGIVSDEEYYGMVWMETNRDQVAPELQVLPGLPSHFEDTNQSAPLNGGLFLLVGFGVAYTMKKKRK